MIGASTETNFTVLVQHCVDMEKLIVEERTWSVSEAAKFAKAADNNRKGFDRNDNQRSYIQRNDGDWKNYSLRSDGDRRNYNQRGDSDPRNYI